MRNYATDNDVIKDLYNKLVEGGLGNVITGDIYLKTKPANSTLENCVVSFLSGRDGQTQTGVVTVNIFVQDVVVYENLGYGEENQLRTEPITEKINEIIHNPNIMSKGRYLWIPNTMISTMSEQRQNLHAHFVHVEIAFSNNICV